LNCGEGRWIFDNPMAYEAWVQREAGALRRILCFVLVYSSIVFVCDCNSSPIKSEEVVGIRSETG